MASPPPRLSDIDIKLLRIFCSIVECGGFTQAQIELNLARSTISTHMSNLETRLGFRLCRRGRGGFALTSRGRVVYDASRALLSSVEGYHARITQLREQIVGEITVGVVDNIITNANCRLSGAIDEAYGTSQDLRIILRVAQPDQVEEQLIRGHLQMAVIPGTVTRKNISQNVLFSETQRLYCGRGHPLFDADPADITPDLIAVQDFVRRGFVSTLTPYSSIFKRPAIAVSHQMEGLAHFVLSGRCLGFLPEDYTRYWVDRGEMRVLLPEQIQFQVPICIARDESVEHSLAASHVYDMIMQAHQQDPETA